MTSSEWPLPQIKQVLVSPPFLEVPFIQLQVNCLLCNFCNLMCSRKVNLWIVWRVFAVTVGAEFFATFYYIHSRRQGFPLCHPLKLTINYSEIFDSLYFLHPL